MSILGVIALMGGFALAGIVLRWLGWVRPEVSTKLNAIALNLTLPAGIFLTLHTFAISRDALIPPAIFAVLTLVWWGLATMVARRLRLMPASSAVFVLTVVFSNTAFIGFPVVEAVYGATGKAHAVLIDQMGGEPLAFTLGAFLAARGAHESLAIPWRAELRRLLTFPPLLALVAAILWKLVGLPPLPGSFATILKGLSALTVPLVMVALGLVVRAGSLRQSLRLAVIVSVLRLIVAPLSAWAACHALHVPADETRVAILEAGMPVMMFTLVLALRYKLDAELCAALITASLIGSVVTLPIWVLLFS
jgi:predicted permease